MRLEKAASPSKASSRRCARSVTHALDVGDLCSQCCHGRFELGNLHVALRLGAVKLRFFERLRKLKVSGRINDLASRGLMVDAEFAEVATDGEWELHVADRVKEKEESDRKAREEQARKDAAQKRIVDRMEIASKLGISVKTVDNHRTNLLRKLDLHDVASLTRYCIHYGLVHA